MYQSNNKLIKTNSSINNLEANPILTNLLILVMSMACGLTVANLYYIQPLLADIAKTFHVNQLSIGFAAMLTQIGYAIGMIFILPLGDIKEKKKINSNNAFMLNNLTYEYVLRFEYIYSYNFFLRCWIYFYYSSTYYPFSSTTINSTAKRANYWYNNERLVNRNITFSYNQRHLRRLLWLESSLSYCSDYDVYSYAYP